MFNRTLYGLLLLLSILCMGQCSRLQEKNQQLQERDSIQAVLSDSIRTTQDKLGREVTSKKVMEAKLVTVEQAYASLSSNQKALVQEVKLLPKSIRKKTSSSSSIQQVATIQHHQQVDTIPDLVHEWTQQSDTLSYRIRIVGDTLSIDSLSIPNRQTIHTYTDSKDVTHMRVVNSNPLITTTDQDQILPPRKKPSTMGKIFLLLGGIAIGIAISR